MTPWTVALQDPLSGIFQVRILEWAAFPFPGDLPKPEMEPASSPSPALEGGFFTTERPETPTHGLIYKTEINSQTETTNLQLPKREAKGRDELGVWD